MSRLALVKLGGSVITYKDRPQTANTKAIDRISKAIASMRPALPLIIVHGGGSFGHYWSTRYQMHTRPERYDRYGISVVHESMAELNRIIVNSMLRQGLNPYSASPASFTRNLRPIVSKIKELCVMGSNGILPVTFGDVVHTIGGKYSILSGDSLMTILSRVLRPDKVIFATNVDGIFQDMNKKELVEEIALGKSVDRSGHPQKSGRRFMQGRDLKDITFMGNAKADVTGGMKRKVTEAFKIASAGMDVLMVNGLVPGRLVRAVQGSSHFIGTRIYSSSKTRDSVSEMSWTQYIGLSTKQTRIRRTA